MTCKDCGKQVGELNFCPYCGKRMEGESADERKKETAYKIWTAAAIAIVATVICLGLYGLYEIKEDGKGETGESGDKKEVTVLDATPTPKVSLAETEVKVSATPKVEETAAPKTTLAMAINQMDTSHFPKVALYFSALDEQGVPIMGLKGDSFQIYEKEDAAPIVPDEFNSSLESIPLSVSLILDNSGSMDGEYSKQAKSCAKQFLTYVDFKNGDQIEIMEFNSDVYVRIPYGRDKGVIKEAIDTMVPDLQTALYDALYMGLVRACSQIGPKCILAFTDGIENASDHSLEEVLDLAKASAIPIYLIGVGSEVDQETLESVAAQTGGRYFYAPSASDLEDIYKEAYASQKSQYRLTYESNYQESLEDWHTITLRLENDGYCGTASKEYVPVADAGLPIEYLFSSVTASSVLKPQTEKATQQTFEYLPYHAIDQKNDTVWVEGAKGDGIGEWLRIDFIRSTTLSGMYVKNGYWRKEERVRENNRIKKMAVEFSDGTREEFKLTDTAKQDYNILTQGNGQKLEFSTPRNTSYVKIKILSVYKGTRWQDTCLTNVQLFR